MISKKSVAHRVMAGTVVAGAVVAFLAAPPSVPVKAFQPYYPYPCPFTSGGRDFDGDGFEMPLAFWDPKSGFWRFSGGGTDTTWGTYGDIPAPGNYNGDTLAGNHVDDVAVWRPSNGNWYVKCSSATNCPGGTIIFNWGTAGDIPVPGDYNNDGFTDYGIWRPSTGTWYIRSGNGFGSLTPAGGVTWGAFGDCPVPGRLAGGGPGIFDLAVWRPSNGVLYYGRSFSTGTGGVSMVFGTYGDIPFSIDVDGNGDGNFVVWRPSTGVWYQTLGPITFSGVAWGTKGDIPSVRSKTSAQNLELEVFRPSTRQVYRCFSPVGAACGSTETDIFFTAVSDAVFINARNR